MNKITESTIERFAIDLLEKQGYHYVYGPDIAPAMDGQVLRAQDAKEQPPDSETPERASFDDVILIKRLRRSTARINPGFSPESREDAIKQILRLNSPELITNNESFHRLLTEGINVNIHKDGNTRGDYVQLVDFNHPENNEFLVSNQFTVMENNVNKRPDIIIFVNGLPLVVIELKNPSDETATVHSAFKQCETYKQAIPSYLLIMGLRLFPMDWKPRQVPYLLVFPAAQVIEELIELSKNIKKMDKEPQEMGLSDFEYAFYTAIANNDSARQVMEKDKLRELAVVLFEKVRENASIDWTIKESMRAKLKVIVKRILRQYGYPPDMQMLATETVLKQAELIADELVKGK